MHILCAIVIVSPLTLNQTLLYLGIGFKHICANHRFFCLLVWISFGVENMNVQIQSIYQLFAVNMHV